MEYTLALLILTLIFLAPGVIFRRVYNSRAISVSRSSNIEPPVNFFGNSLLITILIHTVFILFLSDLVYTNISYPIFSLRGAYRDFVNVISYSYGLDEVNEKYQLLLQDSIQQLFGHVRVVYNYNLVVALFALGSSFILKKFVVYFKLDLRFSVLRYPNPYFYILTGKSYYLNENTRKLNESINGDDFLKVTAKLKNGEVIQGVLGHFTLTKEGYDHIILYEPLKVHATKSGKTKYTMIKDGDFMLLRQENVIRIKVKKIKMKKKN